jgi:hypothetical protein
MESCLLIGGTLFYFAHKLVKEYLIKYIVLETVGSRTAKNMPILNWHINKYKLNLIIEQRSYKHYYHRKCYYDYAYQPECFNKLGFVQHVFIQLYFKV